MNCLLFVLGAAGIAFSALAAAQEPLPDPGNDGARRERMNQAYRDHQAHPGTFARAEENVKRDARSAGHSFHEGLRSTGHAINKGVHATGHAINHGVHATGHAIHHGVDKVTGKTN